MSGIEIDFETADRITVATLKAQLEYLLEEQKIFEASPEELAEMKKTSDRYSFYVHPEDYANNRDNLIPSMKTLIHYFGGSVD